MKKKRKISKKRQVKIHHILNDFKRIGKTKALYKDYKTKKELASVFKLLCDELETLEMDINEYLNLKIEDIKILLCE